jgi:hypothetical protein
MGRTFNSARYCVELLKDQAIQRNELDQATKARVLRYERLEKVRSDSCDNWSAVVGDGAVSSSRKSTCSSCSLTVHTDLRCIVSYTVVASAPRDLH